MRPVSKTLRNITIAAALMTLIILATCWDARAENVHTLDGNVYLTCANGEGTFQGGVIAFQPHGYTATVGQAGLFSVYDVEVDVYTATLSFGGLEFIKGGLTVDDVHVFSFFDDSLCNESEPAQPLKYVYLSIISNTTQNVTASDVQYPYLEYRGIVTIDENGTQVNNQTYFLHCGGNSYSVEVKITWSNGVAEIVKIVNGCEALWYVAVTDSNDVELAEVVAATAEAPEIVFFVYLSLVAR